MPLTTTVLYQHSGVVPAGEVIRTDPAEGEAVDPDSVVTIYVSLGPAPSGRWGGALDATTGLPIHEVASQQAEVVPVVFVYLDIDGSPLYLNNSNCTFEWDGHDWIGAGKMGDIEAISEAHDLIAQPVSMTLTGVDTDVVTDAMDANYKGRDVIIYLALLNPDTLERLDEPEEIWSGFMDVMKLEAGQNHGQITLTCEHWLRISPIVSLYTDQEQQVILEGDRFFQYTPDIPNYVGNWGGRSLSYGGNIGGGGTRGPVRNHH